MAAGDYAASQGYTINAGSQDADEIHLFINAALDYLAYKTGAQGAVIPITAGGTGGATAAAARTALGIPAITPGNSSAPNTIPTYNASNQLTTATPTLSGHAASKGYVDSVAGGGSFLPLAGGTVTGQIYIPNATAATSGYVVSYINGDGRICKGASSARFKKAIDRKPVLKGFAGLVSSYEMRADSDGVRRFGPIVEDMVKAGGEAAALVTYDDQGRPESFDQISYLFACIAELRAEIAELRNG